MFVWHVWASVCVTITVLATFLTTHISFPSDCTRSKLLQASVWWELAHVALPLQSQSALSCCFHSSSESQHSQPHSLPSFTLLAPACSDTFPTVFCFAAVGVGTLGVWTGVDTPSSLNSFIQSNTTGSTGA